MKDGRLARTAAVVDVVTVKGNLEGKARVGSIYTWPRERVPEKSTLSEELLSNNARCRHGAGSIPVVVGYLLPTSFHLPDRAVHFLRYFFEKKKEQSQETIPTLS